MDKLEDWMICGFRMFLESKTVGPLIILVMVFFPFSFLFLFCFIPYEKKEYISLANHSRKESFVDLYRTPGSSAHKILLAMTINPTECPRRRQLPFCQ